MSLIIEQLWTQLDRNGQKWNIMDKLDYHGHNWTFLDKIGLLWTKLDYYGHNWTIMDNTMDTIGNCLQSLVA